MVGNDAKEGGLEARAALSLGTVVIACRDLRIDGADDDGCQQQKKVDTFRHKGNIVKPAASC